MSHDVADTLAKLPPMCAARAPGTDEPILIKRGVQGYWPWHGDVDRFNARHGVDWMQVEAMLCGSMFGWDCPAADPDTHAAGCYPKANITERRRS